MKIFRRFPIVVFTLAALLSQAGCIHLDTDYPVKRQFVLSADRAGETVAAGAEAPVLQVRAFAISPAFEREEFIYRKGEQAYVSDFYSNFFAPPQQMITDQAAQWLAKCGLFRYATGASTRLDPTYYLEGNLVAIYGDLRDLAHPQTVLEISFVLVHDPLRGRPSVVFEKSYRESVDVSSVDAQDIAAGFSRALTRIMTSLEADLRKNGGF